MIFLAQQQQPSAPGSGQMQDIADIAPPVEIPVEPAFPWFWIILVALGFVALGILLYLLRRRLKPEPEPQTPRERALGELREAASAHLETEDSYAFSIRLADILRDYVTGQFGIAMHHQTSPEFLARLRRDPQFDQDSKEVLREFLERSDAFKFAHIDGSIEDNRRLLEKAEDFLNRTDPAGHNTAAPASAPEESEPVHA